MITLHGHSAHPCHYSQDHKSRLTKIRLALRMSDTHPGGVTLQIEEARIHLGVDEALAVANDLVDIAEIVEQLDRNEEEETPHDHDD